MPKHVAWHRFFGYGDNEITGIFRPVRAKYEKRKEGAWFGEVPKLMPEVRYRKFPSADHDVQGSVKSRSLRSFNIIVIPVPTSRLLLWSIEAIECVNRLRESPVAHAVHLTRSNGHPNTLANKWNRSELIAKFRSTKSIFVHRFMQPLRPCLVFDFRSNKNRVIDMKSMGPVMVLGWELLRIFLLQWEYSQLWQDIYHEPFSSLHWDQHLRRYRLTWCLQVWLFLDLKQLRWLFLLQCNRMLVQQIIFGVFLVWCWIDKTVVHECRLVMPISKYHRRYIFWNKSNSELFVGEMV